VFAINPCYGDFNFELTEEFVGSRADLNDPLRQVAKALITITQTDVPADLSEKLNNLLVGVSPSEQAKNIAKGMLEGEKKSIILGAYAWSHPRAHEIYWLSRAIAQLTNATFGEMSNGANSAGGWLAGAVPHRLAFGQKNSHPSGLTAMQMVEHPLNAYLLVQAEDLDFASPNLACEAFKQANVIALSAYDSPRLREFAQVILPVTPISETAGTYVNAWGEWQRFQGAVSPFGQSRPAWKVLRVLANLWHADGFAYDSTQDIVDEITHLHSQDKTHDNLYTDNILKIDIMSSTSTEKINHHDKNSLIRIAPTSLYHVDGITRRAKALQATQDAQWARVRIHSEQAKTLGLQANEKVWVAQNGFKTHVALPIEIDDKIPMGAALVAASMEETHKLDIPFGMIELVRAN
jgi:NADH-quinone oxidoreductase subunit G